MKKKITIVDYGLGNILSAQQSFLRVSKLNNIELCQGKNAVVNIIEENLNNYWNKYCSNNFIYF